MEHSRNDYVKYRLEKANETFLASESLFENGFYLSAVSRLYYACFYAVNALFVDNKIEAQTHSGNKSQFSLHFIKTKIFDKKYGKLYSKLFTWRQKGDYDDFFDFDKETVAELLPQAKEMIETIKNYIEK